MTILFRYILREQLRIFAMCFAGLMTVYLVVDFFEKVRKFVRYDAELSAILWYFLLKTPGIAYQITPLAVLMATLLTMGVFSRNNEVTAMRSCGISLYRLASPFLFFTLVISMGLFAIGAVVMPVATDRAEYVKSAFIEKKSSPPSFKTDRLWLRLKNHTLMNIDLVDQDGATLRGISLYQLGPDFRLMEFTEAREVRYEGHGWFLHQATRRSLLPGGGLVIETLERTPVELSQTPEDFRNWLSVESDQMTLKQIRAYIDRLQKDGYNTARFSTDYHARVAFSFVSVVLAIVAIALSLVRAGMRGGGMAMGIGLALVIGFLYWTTHSFAIALGRTGVLAPVMAGWIGNLLFLSVGLHLFLRVRQ